MDPLGSYWHVRSEGSVDRARSSSLARVFVRGSTGSCRSGQWGPGTGVRPGWGERGQARARAAGTWVLAPKPRGAAPRIPRIPAGPRFCRHVVALCAALTVRLGESAHTLFQNTCGPPRVWNADARSSHGALPVHSLYRDRWFFVCLLVFNVIRRVVLVV